MSSMWVWPFELEEKIGEGGMGVVYRGRYVKNDRRVAVKLLPAEVADPTVLARFEREVKILRDLRHPNIVHSFGGVCEDDRRFYAMELVEGGSLDELLRTRGGKLPWELVVEYGLQMCAALHYAHERGVVHRDVKPGNFLLTKTGKLKLSDFGLATIIAGSNLTSDGRTVGSFRYMSPEQVRGTKEPLPSTDLYSLGCVLMKLLTGRAPFDGTTAGELLNKHLSAEPPRVAELCPECPASLDVLVASLLQKDPNARPADAKDVARQLKEISPVTRLSGDETQDSIRQQKRVVLPEEIAAATAKPSSVGFNRLAAVLGAVAGACILWAFVQMLNAQRMKAAEQMWIESFQTTSNPEAIRIHAAERLGRIGVRDDSIVAVLEKGLSDTNPRLRQATAQALGNAGANSQSAITVLMRLQKKDDNPQVRLAAATAIDKIRSASGESDYLRFFLWAGIVTAFSVAVLLIVAPRFAKRRE